MATLNLMVAPGPGGAQPNITNPVLDLNQTNCEMVQCGAISEVNANLATATPPGPNMPSMPFAGACTAAGWAGPSGGRNCSDPVCKPFIPQIYAAGVSGQGIECCVNQGGIYQQDGSCQMPSATKSTMPSITSTAQTVMPPQQPVLTPQSMAQRMPSIVNPTPVQIAPPCSDPFATWVNDNMLLVGVGLVGLAWLVWGKGK